MKFKAYMVTDQAGADQLTELLNKGWRLAINNAGFPHINEFHGGIVYLLVEESKLVPKQKLTP